MDFIYVRYHNEYAHRNHPSVLEANFGVDCPRVGDSLVVLDGITGVVRNVFRKFQPVDKVFVQYERYVYIDVKD